MNVFGLELHLWQIAAGVIFLGAVAVATYLALEWVRKPDERSPLPEHDLLGQAVNVLLIGAVVAVPLGIAAAYLIDWAIKDGWPQLQSTFANAP